MNLNKFYLEKTNSTVVNGIYKNLILHNNYEHPFSYFLGTYENQLYPYIENALNKKPNIVINIGCGFGYHGIGIANILKDSKCLLVDNNEDCLNIAKKNSEANNLKNTEFINYLTTEQLIQLCKDNEKLFILMDIEGKEEMLLENNFNYKNCIFLIECHDFIIKDVTINLCNKFISTHDVYLIDDRNKIIDYNIFNCEISQECKQLAMSEGRPCVMNWLYISPK